MPNQLTIWDDSESDHEDDKGARGDLMGGCGSGAVGANGGNNVDIHLERGCSDLFEDDEDSESAPRYHRRSARQR